MYNNLYSPGSTGWSTLRNIDEFQEGDIWRVLGGSSSKQSNPNNLDSSRESVPKTNLPTSSQAIPKSKPKQKILQQSAPVNIPDWSKIYGGGGGGGSSKKASHIGSWLDCDDRVGSRSGGFINNSWDSEEDEEEEEEDYDGNLIPPHEWIARKLARTQISSFSVCEGVGRTLKGRDLSNVRNAVLTRTGFLE